MTQAVTGYSKGARMVTVEYTLQVQNQQDSSLASLSLTLVPRAPFPATTTTWTVDELAPGASADYKVTLVTPMLRDQDYFSAKPLLWAGRYTNASGKLVEFPVKSRGGGAK